MRVLVNEVVGRAQKLKMHHHFAPSRIAIAIRILDGCQVRDWVSFFIYHDRIKLSDRLPIELI
jgi:hypothetical protein